MSHRGRKLAAFFVALVILGFVLNNISSRMRNSADASGGGAASPPPARPMAPLYVPRPASLISGGYGGALGSDASPQQVAQAFATVYITYDPKKGSAKSFVSGLPRVSPDAVTRLQNQLPDDWKRFLSKIGGGTTVDSVSDPDPAEERSGDASVTVTLKGESNSGSARLALAMHQGDDGWVVSSAKLNGE
ncbi:hypothetical protein [Streptomyces alanosinicus]|uniref:DUF4878 domain-containing protein n=1 Tax=Streptomyces alanosinicus TaxID=68171 RepID=A0A918YLM3_9ACTN|nr:hypothetical protein [Streptomyces alanosinicus]GHE07343.1 hypothetical protein GCM10010339_52060 [Streptomyces alanosinicus]